MYFYYTLLLSALYLSAGSRLASACQPGAPGYMDPEGSGSMLMDAEGSGMDEGSGELSADDMTLTGADDCPLLPYVCPDGEDCVEATQDPTGTWSCGDDSADYSLHVGDGDGPYESVSCQGGVWSDPTGASIEDSMAANPAVYCLRFVPDE